MQKAYFQQPLLSSNSIYFVTENTLWSAPREGGEARKWVSGQGVVYRPMLSPDKKWISFAFNEEGSIDVYVMSTEDGSTRRLTYHNSFTYPAGWSSDSQAVYITSNMNSQFARVLELFQVSIHGGEITPLRLGHAVWIRTHKNNQAVIGKHQVDLARWKRYRGGTAGTIWIGSLETHQFSPLLTHEAGHVQPQFDGDRIYFISDRDGIGNIYSTDAKGGQLKAHTNHQDFYARNLHVSDGFAVYQLAGNIYLLDLKKNTTQKIPIHLHSYLKPEKSYFAPVKKYTEDVQVSNHGKLTLYTIRGKMISSPNWSGAPKILGTRQGVRYRFNQYLPTSNLTQEGKTESIDQENTPPKDQEAKLPLKDLNPRVVCVSDESGEEVVEIHDHDYSTPPISLGKVPEGRITHLQPSHKGDQMVVGTTARKLWLIDVEKKKYQFRF